MSTSARWAVVAVAVVLAIIVALFVFNGTLIPGENAITEPLLQTVIVSTEDIKATQLLDPLLEKDIFVEVSIPARMLVEGMVTDIRQLASAMTVTRIVANEQIPFSRLALYEGP